MNQLGRRIARSLVVPSLVATGLVLAAPPAFADHHEMKIREVGLDGPSGSDFVELQMYAGGQNLVGGHHLITYEETGTATDFTIPSDVSNAVNQATVLFASAGFVGPKDFTLPSNLMSTSSGAVCFVSNTFGPIDCVEWGGGIPSVSGTPATPPMAGESLERRITPNCPTLLENADDTGDSATDFAVQPTPNPEPNSATPNEAPCPRPILKGLRARVRGNRAIVSGQVLPPAPGDTVSLTFFANGSPLHKVAKKNAVLNADSKFKKRFRIPDESTRCRVKVRFHGDALGKKTFRC